MRSFVATPLRGSGTRRQCARLQQLDGYLLSDIGLNRNDLRLLTTGDRTAHAPSGR